MEGRAVLVKFETITILERSILNVIVKPLVVFVLAMSLFACSAQTDKTVRNEQTGNQGYRQSIPPQHSAIAPGRCRILGTLVGVDSTLEGGGPCSKAPCRGFVRVDSILGYGSAFGKPLVVTKVVNVRFAFTLAATTKDLFPTMTERLPGLEVGARFQADLESQNEIGSGGRNTSYAIQEYQKIN